MAVVIVYKFIKREDLNGEFIYFSSNLLSLINIEHVAIIN